MNTSSMRIYERLRKQSLRSVERRIQDSQVGEYIDWRNNEIAPSFRWRRDMHAAFVAGARAALQVVEADTNKAYEDGLTDGALFYNDEVVGVLI